MRVGVAPQNIEQLQLEPVISERRKVRVVGDAKGHSLPALRSDGRIDSISTSPVNSSVRPCQRAFCSTSNLSLLMFAAGPLLGVSPICITLCGVTVAVAG